jgi:hypothetical protein
LTLLWAQAGAVAFLVYGCFILEHRLLGDNSDTRILVATSEVASYARMVVIALITALGSAFVWFASVQRRPQ